MTTEEQAALVAVADVLDAACKAVAQNIAGAVWIHVQLTALVRSLGEELEASDVVQVSSALAVELDRLPR